MKIEMTKKEIVVLIFVVVVITLVVYYEWMSFVIGMRNTYGG